MYKVNQILNRSGLALLFLTSSCLNLDGDRGFLIVTNAQVYDVGDPITLRIRSGSSNTIYLNPNCTTDNDEAGILREYVVNNEFVEPEPPDGCREIWLNLIPLRPGKSTSFVIPADSTGEYRYRILFYVQNDEGFAPISPFFYSNSFLIR